MRGSGKKMNKNINKKELAHFISRMNRIITCHIGFCGVEAEEIYACLEGDFTEDCMVVTYDCDQIIGFLGLDAYDGKAEVWGPFVHEDYSFEEISKQMWDDLKKSTGTKIHTYYFFINKENHQALQFTDKIGSKFSGEHLILEAKQEEFEQASYFQIVEYEKDLENSFVYLHTIEYPSTYYSAQNIIT